MAVTIRKYRIANPSGVRRRKNSGARKRTAKRKNPGTLMTLGFANPERRSAMKKRRKNPAAPARTRRRRNPGTVTRTKVRRVAKAVVVRHARRRRNPSSASIMGRSTDLFKNGAAALIGLVVTRQLPQMVLGAKNTGLLGYFANLTSAIAVSFAVRKAAGTSAGNAALIGGSMHFASRLLNEYVSPVGKVLSLSGVGDHTAAGLGEIQEAYFPLPVATDPNGRTVLPKAIRQIAAPPVPAKPVSTPATMSGIRGGARFASRW